MGYSDARYRTLQQTMLPGNDHATLLTTPLVGTASGVRTATMVAWNPGRNITLKKLSFLVVAAQSGAGNNVSFDLYKNTTSVGTLAVSTTAVLGIVAQSADMDVAVANTDYLRVYAVSTTTVSAGTTANGLITLTYQEAWV